MKKALVTAVALIGLPVMGAPALAIDKNLDLRGFNIVVIGPTDKIVGMNLDAIKMANQISMMPIEQTIIDPGTLHILAASEGVGEVLKDPFEGLVAQMKFGPGTGTGGIGNENGVIKPADGNGRINKWPVGGDGRVARDQYHDKVKYQIMAGNYPLGHRWSGSLQLSVGGANG